MLQFQTQLAPLQLALPDLLEAGQQRAQIGPREGPLLAGLALQLGRLKNQAKAIDLLTAFMVDLSQALLQLRR